MNILCIRHAQYEGNLQTGKLWGQSPKMPLTQLGETQASYLPDVLDNVTLAGVYSSDALRAVQTGQIGTKQEPVIMPQFAELSRGNYEGVAIADIPRDLVEAYRADPITFKFPGGENYIDGMTRFVGGLQEVVENHNENDTVAIVSHGNVLKSGILGKFCGNLPGVISRRFDIPNASITKLRAYILDGELSVDLVSYADVSHIPQEYRT